MILIAVAFRFHFSATSFEKINAEKKIEQVHTHHAKESERELNTLSELGGVFYELHRYENVRKQTRY